MLKNAIWDLDGTLYDTYPVMVQALVAALDEQGIMTGSADLLKLIKTKSIRFAGEYFGKVYGIDEQKLLQDYHTIEAAHQQRPQLYPGAKKVLKEVSKKGQNFLLTHRDQQALTFLKDDGLDILFTELITADNQFPRKPDPSAIKYLVNKYNLSKIETAMIGDRPLDFKAGQNAGVKTIYFDVDQYHQGETATYQVPTLKAISALY